MLIMKFITAKRISIIAVCAMLFPIMLTAAEPPVDESWPDEDTEWRTRQVNEGRLEFIAPIPDQPILHSDTHLWISNESKRTGRVEMQQCYRHLDAVSRTDVVYAYRDMKNLRVTRAEKIARIRVGQQGVELEDVGKGAVLCVQADVRVLQRLSDKTYAIQNGPYHRKFLDGYYPYHVSLRVHYSRNEIQLSRVMPEEQDGFEVKELRDGLSIDSWFEGVLRIRLEFLEK